MHSSNPLRRFWFSFDKLDFPTPLNLGCGVTAHDYDDAVCILKERVISNIKEAKIRSVIEDVDVSTLDVKHVRPNMGLVIYRGIWFPLNEADGYQRSS